MNITVKALIFFFVSTHVTTVFSQSNKVEIIDHYGRGFTNNATRNCLTIQENVVAAFITDDKAYSQAIAEMETCLLKLPGIRQAEVSFVCCTKPDNQWIVYVGLDTAATARSGNKTADIGLPESIINRYDQLMKYLMEAIEKNEASEDKSMGHSLIKYEPAQKIQREFITYANTNLELLQSVLRTSKYSGEREIAATVIAYHSNKNYIINDLLDALTDPEAGVRNNAIRAVGIIADYAIKKPELNITISAKPFIELMNSISWSDRNKSSMVLLSLTQKRNPEIMRELKVKALKSITDMAAWRNFGHSMPGYILLGRIVGWKDEVIMSGVNNERTAQIEEMLKAMK